MISLQQAKLGQVGVVCRTCADQADAALLRAMGLRVAARVRVCRLGEPCIIEVMGGPACEGRCDGGGCRIGLSKALAEQVMIEDEPAARPGSGPDPGMIGDRP